MWEIIKADPIPYIFIGIGAVLYVSLMGLMASVVILVMRICRDPEEEDESKKQ